ncbi:MAG TPA: hypothetical protein VF707_16940 [Ardenticatenaceae bacterium]|jgi:hypothetical protein
MDPISIIVTALALGAAAGLKDTSAQVVKDAYAGFKALIKQRYPSVTNVDQLEKTPESAGWKTVVQEELQKTNAATDDEVLREAQRLLDAVKNEAPGVAQIVGVTMEEIEAASIRLKDIIATGAGSTGASLKNVRATGDIDIQGVRAGGSSDSDPKK